MPHTHVSPALPCTGSCQSYWTVAGEVVSELCGSAKSLSMNLILLLNTQPGWWKLDEDEDVAPGKPGRNGIHVTECMGQCVRTLSANSVSFMEACHRVMIQPFSPPQHHRALTLFCCAFLQTCTTTVHFQRAFSCTWLCSCASQYL